MRLGTGAGFSAFVLACFLGCQTITEELPTDPDPVIAGGETIPVVVVPIVLPSPTAPNPGPTANPAPGSTPAPPAPPSSQSCSLPKGDGRGDDSQCRKESQSFLREVESALDQLIREEPGIFNLRDGGGCGTCYAVVNVNRYVARMPELMRQRGFCSMYDGEELVVKNTNAFNDAYDILTADHHIRRQGGSYVSTCHPAWF